MYERRFESDLTYTVGYNRLRIAYIAAFAAVHKSPWIGQGAAEHAQVGCMRSATNQLRCVVGARQYHSCRQARGQVVQHDADAVADFFESLDA